MLPIPDICMYIYNLYFLYTIIHLHNKNVDDIIFLCLIDDFLNCQKITSCMRMIVHCLIYHIVHHTVTFYVFKSFIEKYRL